MIGSAGIRRTPVIDEMNLHGIRTSEPILVNVQFLLVDTKLICMGFEHRNPLVPLVINTRRYFALVDTFKPCSSGLNERRTTFLQSTGDYLVINN